ncbi:MAG: hypothetical protein JWM47_1389 [Acidimicrobiales bacterium]|nr:hypothetical protein [Acidimicrobiales bacterium]
MHQLALRRIMFAPLAIAMALALALPALVPQPAAAEERTTAVPSITWTFGGTHGLREDRSTMRLTLVIYRGPTLILQQAWMEGGVRAVQETLWDRGRPPRFAACPSWGGPCVQQTDVVRLMELSIFSQPWNLRRALALSATPGTCLGLRVIDRGHRVSQWTTVLAGCRSGRLVGPA